MTACLALAAERGLREEEIREINFIHSDVEVITARGLSGELSEEAAIEMLTDSDYQLQELWGFSKDANFHTYAKSFLFKRQWVGRTFKCLVTGETLTLQKGMVHERAFIPIGGCYLDLGRLDAYSRIVGDIVEVLQA